MSDTDEPSARSPARRTAAEARTVDGSSESTPLLSRPDSAPRYEGEHDEQEEVAEDDDTSIRSQLINDLATHRGQKKSRRWPSIIAMIILALLSVAIIVMAFFVPAAVEEYAKQALVLEPTNLSLESITADGVRARIQANFRLDGGRVQNEHVRRVGKAATWLVRELGTDQTVVRVYLPEYDQIMVGSASVPPLVVNIMDGHSTTLDFVADLVPGDANGIRTIANEWLEGRLDVLRLQGQADIPLKSGIIPLGTHAISEALTVEAHKLPQLPRYNITKMSFHEVRVPGQKKDAMRADVSVLAFNAYPISAEIPELSFDILVPGCVLSDPYIVVAQANTMPLAIRPRQDVEARVMGLIQSIPESLTRACPNSDSSPLDIFLKDYMVGKAATIFVRGRHGPDSNAPGWITDILSSVVLPVPFPGRSFDNLVKNFSMTDVHLSMPNPSAEPGDPDANPKVSGTINVFANLPDGINFEINVTDVRANADVFYASRKLGELNLREWQKASSSRVSGGKDAANLLKIQAGIKDAPLTITDSDVLTEVLQAMFLGGKVTLKVAALVDVQMQTVLGQLVLKDVPASGRIPVKPIPSGGLGRLAPEIGNLEILETTPTSLKLQALVNITNPTPYSADIPFGSVHIICNGSLIGEATAQNLSVTTGNNTNLRVTALWNPSLGNETGIRCGRDFLSSYISGLNASFTIRGHHDSVPGQPLIGDALARLEFPITAPRLRLPGQDDEEQSHFIRDAIFHIFSSSATFTLVSPLQRNVIYLDHVNATAYYNHTEPVGHIVYDLPLVIPPGASQTPKLPVDWSLDSVGYEKLRSALGGRMKLDAKAVVGVRLGTWTQSLWYVGRGIGAGVRL